MVTGGWSSGIRHDSTEIFSDNVWRTVAGKLPGGGVSALRIATINNQVLSFGKIHNFCSNMKERFQADLKKVKVPKIRFWSLTLTLNHGLRSVQ